MTQQRRADNPAARAALARRRQRAAAILTRPPTTPTSATTSATTTTGFHTSSYNTSNKPPMKELVSSSSPDRASPRLPPTIGGGGGGGNSPFTKQTTNLRVDTNAHANDGIFNNHGPPVKEFMHSKSPHSSRSDKMSPTLAQQQRSSHATTTQKHHHRGSPPTKLSSPGGGYTVDGTTHDGRTLATAGMTTINSASNNDYSPRTIATGAGMMPLAATGGASAADLEQRQVNRPESPILLNARQNRQRYHSSSKLTVGSSPNSVSTNNNVTSPSPRRRGAGLDSDSDDRMDFTTTTDHRSGVHQEPPSSYSNNNNSANRSGGFGVEALDPVDQPTTGNHPPEAVWSPPRRRGPLDARRKNIVSPIAADAHAAAASPDTGSRRQEAMFSSEGPLSARRMKMSASPDQQQQQQQPSTPLLHDQNSARQNQNQTRTAPFPPSPRRHFVVEDPRSASRKEGRESDLAAQQQISHGSRTSPRRNVTQQQQQLGGFSTTNNSSGEHHPLPATSRREMLEASSSNPYQSKIQSSRTLPPSGNHHTTSSSNEDLFTSARRNIMTQSDKATTTPPPQINDNNNRASPRTGRNGNSPSRQNARRATAGRYGASSPRQTLATTSRPASSDIQHQENQHRPTPTPPRESRASTPTSNSEMLEKFYDEESSLLLNNNNNKESSTPRQIMVQGNHPAPPKNIMQQRGRPPPIQTREVQDNYYHSNTERLPRQAQAQASSPLRQNGHGYPTSVHVRSPSPVKVRAVHSPGVQQLSSMLIETSSYADISSSLGDLPSQRTASQGVSNAVQQQHPVSQKVPPMISNSRYGRNSHKITNNPIPNPGILDQRKLQTLDSSCLNSGSLIMLRAYCTTATVEARKSKDMSFYAAQPTGLCLGRDEEILKVANVTLQGVVEESGGLRHGATVVFYSSVVHDHALGARKVGRERVDARYQLGFFSTVVGLTEQWTILTARTDKEVLVGRAALTSNSSSDESKSEKEGLPVRSGDPILLRNCYNGGILSVDGSGSLVLLTDSYDQSRIRNQQAEDPSLLDRLQHHDRLSPSNNETFQLLSSSMPPCPQWISGRDTDERIYLTGSYLLQPRRNQRSAEFESHLFGGTSMDSGRGSLLQQVPTDETLTPNLKEAILLDEVIGSFLGLEGKHIRLKGAKGSTWSLDDFEFHLFNADGVTFDAGLRNLVEQILPLSTSFVRVRNFVSSHHPGYEFGKAMHAFCEALDGLLEDYVAFVAQLERQHRQGGIISDALTMKSIYFQITPPLHSMSILEHATKAVREKKGGALINALRSLGTRVYMGDLVAKKVLTILHEKASVPYTSMLTTWLQSGVLQDPYEEFMVERSKSFRAQEQSVAVDGDAWSALFVIKEQHVLEGAMSSDWTTQKVLTTGKYWNAVQACNVEDDDFQVPIDCERMPALLFNSDCSAVSSYIDSMYQSASRALVRLLKDKFKLMEALQTVKRYFLLDRGDFLMNFLDAAQSELLKEVEDVSIGRVQHWLSMSIQLTEPQRDEAELVADLQLTPAALRCRFASGSLIDHLDALGADTGRIADRAPLTPSRHVYGMSANGLTGIEAFFIDFPRIPFPLSLVLSQHAMEKYKMLFRHLFFAKHVERRLIAVWRDHHSLKGLDSIRGLLGPTFLLRQRMSHFLQNLNYYMTFEVIESNWTDMQSSIEETRGNKSPSQKEQTVDDILDIHDEFLRRTLEACLLTDGDLLRSLTKLMNTCLLFSDQMKRFMETTRIVSEVIMFCTELVFPIISRLISCAFPLCFLTAG
jgi:gamma-tubulin complex component 2